MEEERERYMGYHTWHHSNHQWGKNNLVIHKWVVNPQEPLLVANPHVMKWQFIGH